MIQHINFNGFCDSFSESYKNNFTYDGKRALFDYLEQFEEDADKEMELDVVAICCDYNEYSDIKEYLDNYGSELKVEDYSSEEDYKKAVMEEISDKTTVIPIENSEGFIIQAY